MSVALCALNLYTSKYATIGVCLGLASGAVVDMHMLTVWPMLLHVVF